MTAIVLQWMPPRDGRVVTWLYVAGDVCSPITMTVEQAEIVHDALTRGEVKELGWERVAAAR